jgi:plastocyanin
VKLVPLVFAAALLAPWSLRAATVDVSVNPDLTYSPKTVTIQSGDTVRWTNAGGTHNVRAADDSFSSGEPASDAWTFSRTFNTPGTYGYYCTLHGSAGGFGMAGTVIVEGSGGGEERGTIRFSLAAYSVSEGAGTATISVQRVNGDDGPVSVQYNAGAGTATAGQDFTPRSGTLSWTGNDDDPKSFTVAILNDGAAEGNETVQLTLTNPTGGAALDDTRKTAVLTIQDNDGGGNPGPLTAPSNLQATAGSTSEILLTWADNSTTETGFRIERRTAGGTYQEIATVGANVTSFTAPGLEPSSFYLFRVRASGSGATNSAFSTEAGTATLGDIAACAAGPQTLCLNNNRFKVEVDWRTGENAGPAISVPLPAAPDSGLFYFFFPTNIEMLVKVLNACVDPFNHYWVFYAATTNVEFAVVVTDTQTGRTRGYFNPLNRTAPPVQDVSAFPTCP